MVDEDPSLTSFKKEDVSISVNNHSEDVGNVNESVMSPHASPTHTTDLILSNPSLPDTVPISDQNVTLTWRDLDVDAVLPPPSCFKRLRGKDNGPKRKSILKKVTGEALPGSLLAIMGASGAGKTTFLNVLSHQNMSNIETNGDILVNGFNLKHKIKNISAYVQQEDLFIGTLTVKEHLTFQALLRMGDRFTKKQVTNRVNEVLQQLGLIKCKDTVIGVPGRIKGISGGENKRLSFASEIITNPNLLFVDEPTSGLDSFMAESVISALQDIAKEGKTILATIHQPSSEVFQMFDRLLLMSEGRTAFLGNTADAITFFNNVGHPCPVNYNPADHYVHTLAIIPGKEDECKEKAMAICDYYDQQDPHRSSKGEYTPSADVQRPKKNETKVGFFKQFGAVLWRSWQSNAREPFISTLRIAQAVIIALIAGLVYLRQDDDSDGAENLNGALFFAITTLTFNTITSALFVFPAELPVFLKEYKLGMYRTDVYFLSKTLSELPWYIGSTFIFSTILYWMVGLRSTAEAFFLNAALLQLVAQCSLSFGYFVSAISPTVQVASSIGPPLIMPFLLFGGFFIKDKSIPDYFIPLKWLSWFKYSNECLQIVQWDDYGELKCNRPDNSTCLLNGNQVLQRSSYDTDNFGRNVGLLFALLLGFRILAFIFVLLRAKRAK